MTLQSAVWRTLKPSPMYRGGLSQNNITTHHCQIQHSWKNCKQLFDKDHTIGAWIGSLYRAWKKNLEFQLALQTTALKYFLPWAAADKLPGPLHMGQVRKKKDLSSKKMARLKTEVTVTLEGIDLAPLWTNSTRTLYYLKYKLRVDQSTCNVPCSWRIKQ